MRLFTIDLSSGVDVTALGELAHQTGGAFLYADNAQQLLPLHGSLGKLLTLSLPTYRLRWTMQADTPTLSGQATPCSAGCGVTSGSNTCSVPFLIGIP